MSISKHIIELLHKHDCVIIPGFGAFLTKSIPASYSKVIHYYGHNQYVYSYIAF